MSGARILFSAMLAMAASGCGLMGHSQPTRVTMGPDAFYRSVPSADDPHQTAVDNPGMIPTRGAPAEIRAQSAQPQQGETSISTVVKEVVVQPSPTTAPTTNLSTTTPTIRGASGEYMTVGAVVTEVSGTPIYADKVIQQLTPLLSSEAKQRDMESYRLLAAREIEKQVEAMIRNELEYATAQQNLGADDK